MPPVHPPSQPDGRRPGWLLSEPGRQLVGEVQRGALPELTRVFGQYGLYLRPSASLSADLSGNMLANVISLHREGGGLSGQVQCQDGELPISSGSLSLVYALFILDSSPEPTVLLQEFARVLKPEGVALLINWNPWSVAQLRWLRAPGSTSAAWLERQAQDVGLEVARRHHLGPYWPSARTAIDDQGGNGWLDGFRAASLTVLRRREAGLTPLRKAASAVSLRPGMSAGLSF
ncbi:MAG: methyltransferase domain-containing protein [Arenimonas sp.]